MWDTTCTDRPTLRALAGCLRGRCRTGHEPLRSERPRSLSFLGDAVFSGPLPPYLRAVCIKGFGVVILVGPAALPQAAAAPVGAGRPRPRSRMARRRRPWPGSRLRTDQTRADLRAHNPCSASLNPTALMYALAQLRPPRPGCLTGGRLQVKAGHCARRDRHCVIGAS